MDYTGSMKEEAMGALPNEGAGKGYTPERKRVSVESTFFSDEHSNPKGGETRGEGFFIRWQNGVQDLDGATLEEVIDACVQRLSFFQGGKFPCAENALAIASLQGARAVLELRQRNRPGGEKE